MESKNIVDPFCIIHGKRMSEHHCLYCCLCFKPLTVEECHLLPSGKREDVCNDCAQKEQEWNAGQFDKVVEEKPF